MTKYVELKVGDPIPKGAEYTYDGGVTWVHSSRSDSVTPGDHFKYRAPVTTAPKPKFQVRKNKGKRPLATQVPLGAINAIAHAAQVGLVKYWSDGYRDDGGYPLSTCLDSAVRHIFARTGGEKYDKEASELLGEPVDNLELAIWNLSAACEALRLYGEVNDDLWKGPGSAKKPEEVKT